jgi:hypothetical protein
VKLGRPKIDSATERKVGKQLAKGLSILKVARFVVALAVSGIGRETAIQFATAGATVVCLRDELLDGEIFYSLPRGPNFFESELFDLFFPFASDHPLTWLAIYFGAPGREGEARGVKLEHKRAARRADDP